MTHEEAFLQAILQSPDDDLPRLVYADWLTDQGDPRGEFVHVQCLLATSDGDDSRRPQLEARQQELLDRHQDAWLGSLRPLLCRWTFRRGFLDEVVVPAAGYLAHGLMAWPATVRRVGVDLEGFEVAVEAVEFVPEGVAREYVLMPLGFRGRTLVLAVQDPRDEVLLETARFIFREVEPVAVLAEQIVAAINRHYGEPETEAVISVHYL